MPFSPTTFTDNQAPAVDAIELNKLGSGIASAPYGPDGSSGFAPIGDGSGAWIYKKITDSEIATNAAIAYSKLALAGQIKNADVATGAAIARSKLDFGSGLVDSDLSVAAAISLSKLSFPGDATEALHGDGSWSRPPGYKLDYAQITAQVGPIGATTEGTAVAVVTGNSVAYDGSQVKVEFWCPGITSGAGSVTFVVLRDTTVVGHFAAMPGSASGAVSGVVFDTPSAANHIYKVSCYVNVNNCWVEAGAGGSGNFLPAFLRVTKA